MDFETEIRIAVGMIRDLGGPEKLVELNNAVDYLLEQIPEGSINNEINAALNGESEGLCDFVRSIVKNYIQVYMFIMNQCSEMLCKTINDNAIVSRNKQQISKDYLILTKLKGMFDNSKVLALIELI